ncbi:MAG: DUF3080 domain-containing protein [Gammaproteobacteria bacterium]|nr:DUF3080 domain-containing protein [Gammaproteobacteria bacterium]MBU2058714.1 DUF3080 domain-containing protein [Gammaproteobacteria bacterium]MBU2177165.1 DUF3080 domain-containing protein [Gammaproteobacteria bacterium]MBU2246418.1 DUF3080 domain-containing protein [Gammaproteobacteria bacterium]MBU2342595.1 DUF3080 domain-containing protein [Gammaproteobacteria bacterium]
MAKFYSSNRLHHLTKLLSLIAVICVASGCSDPALSLMDDYTKRLGRTLALEIEEPKPLDLPPLPSITTTRADIPDSSISLVELVATRACGLDVLLGERNSSLGKVMSPSQRLKYELEFLKQVQPCLTDPAITPDLQQKLSGLALEKTTQIDKHWQNFLQQDETLRQQLHPSRTLSAPNSVAGVVETMQALHSLLGLKQHILEQNWQKASQINPELALEALYKANTLSQLQQSLRFSQHWLQNLNQQLEQVDVNLICPAAKHSDKADILHTILLQYFIAKVQVYFAQTDSAYQQLYPLLQQLYQGTTLAQSIQQRFEAPNTALKAELKRHVIWWKAIQQQCPKS